MLKEITNYRTKLTRNTADIKHSSKFGKIRKKNKINFCLNAPFEI